MNSQFNILIAGGGTGGHLFPAIAVAEEIASSYPTANVSFVGTSRGLEARIIPITMWELILMKVPTFKGAGFFRKLQTILLLPVVCIASLKILFQKKPVLVIGVGGYAAGPLTLMASLIGIKTATMEQNAIPGLTNRILGKFVDKVFVTFAESIKYFSDKKVIVSGNPVRRKIKEAATHGMTKKKGFTILVFGGSQGAKIINDNMLEALNYLSEVRDDIHLIHQIGRQGDAEKTSAVYRAKGFSAEIYHFIEDMGKMYAMADLVICRAGATSIAELTVTGKPAILIPYPYAADNHQELNALEIVSQEGAIMIPDRELTGEKLANEIKSLLEEPLRLASMSVAMRGWGKPDAARVIVNECMKLVMSYEL